MKQVFLLLSFVFIITISVAQSSWHAIQGIPPSWRIDDISFIDSTRGWMCVSDYDVYKTTNGGNTWTPIAPVNGFVRATEFINDSIGFIGKLKDALTSQLFFRSADGGYTWACIDSLLPPGTLDVGLCGISHYNNTILAVSAYSGASQLFISADAGLSWTAKNYDSLAYGLVDVFMIDSLNWLISGQSDNLSGYKATVIKTTDGGNTWNRVAISSEYNTYCWKMFFLPSGIGYAAIEDFDDALLFKTVDWGDTWQETFISNAGNNFDLGGVGFLNDTMGWITPQHSTGMFETTNGGSTWAFSNFGVNMNRFVKLNATDMIASGEIIYKYSNTTGLFEPPVTPKTKIHTIEVSPNPVTNTLKIKVNLGSSTMMLLDLLEVNGKNIRQLERKFFTKGEYQFILDAGKLNPGSYLIHMRTNEDFVTKKFEVVK
jgi:photosystem II stability/assembly factor-like uncharacterized protein